MENLTGGTPPVRYLPCVVPCKLYFPDSKIYRIGGDEFVVFPSDAQEQPCRVRMEEISARLAAQGYSISYGLAVRKEAVGLRGLVREADERMLEAKHAYYAARRRSPRIGASAK